MHPFNEILVQQWKGTNYFYKQQYGWIVSGTLMKEPDTQDPDFMSLFKWILQDQWFSGTSTGGWGNLHRDIRKFWGDGYVVCDDCGGRSTLVMYYGRIHLSEFIELKCLCFVSKLHLNKAVFKEDKIQPKALH